ncbi:MAG: single-stranded DNA-binding protein [Lentisphaerae bacterium]|jgi:single-strand DNA-binding protein|nr:single-stranded DNA-binding protein [Lentisphaerota bacterium]
MANLNKVMLMGNLTREPMTKSTTSGVIICEMGLAINRRFRTAQGEEREEVCFVDIEAFGRTAEICAQYLRKGSPVFFEGRLRLDQWVDKASGQNRSRLKVVVESMQLLGSREYSGQFAQGADDSNGAYGQPQPPPGAYQQQSNNQRYAQNGYRQPWPTQPPQRSFQMPPPPAPPAFQMPPAPAQEPRATPPETASKTAVAEGDAVNDNTYEPIPPPGAPSTQREPDTPQPDQTKQVDDVPF